MLNCPVFRIRILALIVSHFHAPIRMPISARSFFAILQSCTAERCEAESCQKWKWVMDLLIQ